MKMNNRKGFTLVEMLVVIAVIGIISTVALTALGPSRDKAKDSRVISGLNQIRAIAETVYDGDYADVTLMQTEIARSNSDIKLNNGNIDITIQKDANNTAYAASSPLLSGGFYCVDSNGNTKQQAALAVVNGVCQ